MKTHGFLRKLVFSSRNGWAPTSGKHRSDLSAKCPRCLPPLGAPLGDIQKPALRGGGYSRGQVLRAPGPRVTSMRGWQNAVELVPLEISNSMTPYPSGLHAYASNSRPATGLFEPSKRVKYEFSLFLDPLGQMYNYWMVR